MVPLPFGGVPQLQDRITVLGYPTGGDQLSITEGVVSRVGVSRYIHASFSLLTAQIDAAINPGNSGGPAVVNGLVVGVAFEGFNQLQNIGYVVPYPVIQQFLHDLTLHGRYTGIPTLGVKTFDMENPSLDDASLKDKLPAGISLSGVLIVEVDQLRTRRHLTGKIRLPVASWPIQHEFKSSSSLLLSQPSSPSSPSRLSSSPVPPSSLAQPPFPHHHQHPAMGLGTGDNRHERLRHLEEEEEPSIRSSSSLLSAEGEKKNKEDKDEDALEERKKETKKNRKSVSPSSSATSKKNEAVRPTVSQGLSPSFIERQRLKRYLSSRAGERHFLSYLAREGGSFSFMHSSSRGLTKEILSKEKPFVAEKEEKGDEEDRHSRFKTEGSQVSVGSSSDIETTGDEEEDVHSQGDGDQKEKESNRERYEERGGKNKRKMDEGEGKTTEEEEEGRRRNGQGEKEEEKERDSLRTAHSNTGGEGRHHLVDNPYFNEEMRRHLQKASSDHTLGLRSGDVLLSIENI
ncbi:trypsin domain-containing protein, partial [Cystoisospora suis]